MISLYEKILKRFGYHSYAGKMNVSPLRYLLLLLLFPEVYKILENESRLMGEVAGYKSAFKYVEEMSQLISDLLGFRKK